LGGAVHSGILYSGFLLLARCPGFFALPATRGAALLKGDRCAAPRTAHHWGIRAPDTRMGALRVIVARCLLLSKAGAAAAAAAFCTAGREGRQRGRKCQSRRETA
jgi:hypothetical protein